MNEAIEEAKKAIVMKSGLVLWVRIQTAEKIERAMTEPDFQHCFVKIEELGETINTAQVEGVYSPAAYEELMRMKQGEIKCRWGNFHKKKDIDKCDCEAEARREKRRKDEDARRAREYAPVKPEDRAKYRDSLLYTMEEGALSGMSVCRSMFVVGNKKNRMIRRSSVERWEKEKGAKAILTGLLVEPPAPKKRATIPA